jgi:hypothetical protein
VSPARNTVGVLINTSKDSVDDVDDGEGSSPTSSSRGSHRASVEQSADETRDVGLVTS